MPFMAVDTWEGINSDVKKQWMKRATANLIDMFNIPPDKIQCLFRENKSENFSKAGAVPTDDNFEEKSRLYDWGQQLSYHDGESEINNMVIIGIDGINIYTQEQRDAWVKMLTDLSVELLNVPADKVLILIRELGPGYWGQTGYTINHPDFFNLSRQIINPPAGQDC